MIISSDLLDLVCEPTRNTQQHWEEFLACKRYAGVVGRSRQPQVGEELNGWESF